MLHSVQARPFKGLVAFLALTLASSLATTVHADDEDMFLGIAHYHRAGPYRTSAANFLEPTGDYEGERFILRGDTVGMRLWRKGGWSFDLIAQQDLLAFRPNSADTPALRHLKRRRDGVNAGFELAWTPTSDDAMHLSETMGVLGPTNAMQTSLEYDHTFTLPVSYTQIIPTVAFTRYAAAYSRYYFGISTEESLRTGLGTFTPNGTSRTDVGVTVVQPFSKNLAMFVDFTHKRYGNGIELSPMVARIHYTETNIGLVYNVKSLF
jgi:outer membrane protein